MMNKNNVRTYSDLQQLHTFEERYKYLKLHGEVGNDTFGFDRYINQQFYKSKEWKDVRNQVIVRDNGCDLGVKGMQIKGKVYIHHMNPIDVNDISEATDYLLNPEYLICVSQDTHNAIHYGTKDYGKSKEIIKRAPNDTCPWKR